MNVRCSRHEQHVAGIPVSVSTDVTTVPTTRGPLHLPVVLVELARGRNGDTPVGVSEVALVIDPATADDVVELLTDAIRRAVHTAETYGEGMAAIDDLTKDD